jgi:hypothetical protein
LVDLSKWVKEEQTWWDKHYTKMADQVNALKSRKAGRVCPNTWLAYFLHLGNNTFTLELMYQELPWKRQHN